MVSPQRADRPWQGQIEPPDLGERPRYDPQCYLCPGNRRANGDVNPHYPGVFAFDNDFPAILDKTAASSEAHPLLISAPAVGACRVLCFSPDHGCTLAEMPVPDIARVVDLWASECEHLGRTYTYVQVFENKGAMMGCSNPHPHGQIWATAHVPDEAAIEDRHQARWFADHGRALLGELAELERGGPRAVTETQYWLAIVPFWAAWPFETLLLPKFSVQRLPDLLPDQREDLARALSDLTIRYDNLFRCSFPYSMGWHGAPFNGLENQHWQLHAHFYPPLLRSASVRKFMVGYEMLAEAQRDLTPEQAAERLRAVSGIHYRVAG